MGEPDLNQPSFEQTISDDELAPSPPRPLSPFAASPPRRVALQITAALILILAVMGWIEFSGPAILDNDGYYHIRWAAMSGKAFLICPRSKLCP